MKKVIISFLIVVFLLVLGGGGLYLYYMDQVENPFTNARAPQEIVVSENESLYRVLERLQGEGKIRSANIAKIYYKLINRNLDIKPGTYAVKEGANLKDLLDALQGVNTNEITITFPEGFTVEQIGERLEENKLVTKEDFIKAVKEYKLPAYIKEDKDRRYQLEGFLFPDTYTFTKDTKAEEIIDMMNKSFEVAMKEKIKSLNIDLPEDKWDEVVVKASMIEKETYVAEERPIIASVIENRLKDGMKLQIDATILYAINDQHKEITMDDILFENPFNTYYVEGLPVGPICNPSIESIGAVLKPASTDYLFYVLNPISNKHFFTKDYDEFEVKRKEYIGVTTVPKASNTNKLGPSLSTKAKTNVYEDTKGYSSNSLKPDNKGIEIPKITIPENFFKIDHKPL